MFLSNIAAPLLGRALCIAAFLLVMLPSFPLVAVEDHDAVPVLVLIEQDPWHMVVGSDSPSFALYRNGEAIFLTDEGYRHAKLKKREFDSLITELEPSERIARFDEYYNLTSAADQVTQIFFIESEPKDSAT